MRAMFQQRTATVNYHIVFKFETNDYQKNEIYGMFTIQPYSFTNSNMSRPVGYDSNMKKLCLPYRFNKFCTTFNAPDKDINLVDNAQFLLKIYSRTPEIEPADLS